MTAVYGDFMWQATEHMQTAAHCSQQKLRKRPTLATLDAAQQMTKVLLRYLHDFTPETIGIHGQRVHLWDRVNDPRILLQEANRILHRLGDQVVGHPRDAHHLVPTHISAATLALGTGHDLLKTHYTPRSDWANALEHPDVQLALLDMVARQARLLGLVMEAVHNELRRAGLPFTSLYRLVNTLRTSGEATTRPTGPWGTETLAAVPLRTERAPTSIRPTSSVEEICTGIVADAEGIRAALPVESAVSGTRCERNAAAAAVIVHCAHDVVTLLIRRHIELHPSSDLLLRRTLRKSVEELDRVSKRWQAIRRCWARSVMKTESPAESPHLDRMVIRMGRLGSRDPEWTIKRRDLMPMKTPAELAPTSSDMSRVLLSMRRALEALAILAERDATGLITDRAALGIVLNPLVNASSQDDAARTAVIQPLLIAYREVIGHTNVVLSHLNQATLQAAAPTQCPGLAAEISELDRRRDPSVLTALSDSPLIGGTAPPRMAADATIKPTTSPSPTNRLISRSFSGADQQSRKPTR